MSIWQGILIAGFILAVTVGRADKRLAAVMALNFAVTYAMPNSIGIIGVSDIIAAIVAATFGIRGRIIASMYLISAIINAFGSILHWHPETTYAILDPIGWFMLMVMAHVDSGFNRIGSALRYNIGRHFLSGNPMDQGHNARVRVAMFSSESDVLKNIKGAS